MTDSSAPTPAAAPSEEALTSASTPAPSNSPVHTYHCLCTHLVLGSTTPLSSLPRRSPTNSADRAYILSLPAPPARRRPSDASDSDADDVTAAAASSRANASMKEERGSSSSTSNHYALLLSTVLERRPQVVRSENGFEKRYLQRCGRCRVPVGYQLDWAQYSGVSPGTEGKTGRREDVVYLLPGGLLSTEEMAAGKDMGKGIALGA